jgi:hypothetical protein
MVLFGPLSFQHVLTIQLEKRQVELDRVIPIRDYDYRIIQADQGRAVKVAGEIRSTVVETALMELQKLRRFRDGVARSLDLQDGTTGAFTAKMGNLQSSISVESWFPGKYHIAYAVDLLEA